MPISRGYSQEPRKHAGMRRLEVRYRPEALSDLDDIFDTILRVSASQVAAERFVSRILAWCSRIGNAPHAGRPRDDLESGLRTVPFERTAVIAYRITDAVEITNVFYGGRDYEALYREPSED
jgi:toxin ParE1/3/4